MKDRRISRNILYTGLTSFLTDTAVKMVYAVMPMFLMSIGASRTGLAFIEGVAESTASLFKALSGYWSDRKGRNKPFMLAGYGISAIMIPLYALVISPLQVLLLRFAERLGKGIRTSPRDSLIAASAAKGKTGTGFGLQKAMDNSGAIFGPLLAFIILVAFPGRFRLVFLIAGIPAFAGILVVLSCIREKPRKVEEDRFKFRVSELPKRYYLFLCVVFLFTLGNSTDALLMIKANEAGIKVAFIPLVYMLSSLVSVVLAIPMGALSDRLGREKMLLGGYLVYGFVYFGFGRSSDIAMIVALFALYGVYSAATDGIQKAYVSDLVKTGRKGTGLGLYHAILGVTLLPASVLAGLLYDRVGPGIPFYFGACTAVLSAALLYLLLMMPKHHG